MQTIEQLREGLPDRILSGTHSQIRHFARSIKIDYDVYLPTRKLNLQRDFVWTLEQKQELIWSILKGRSIPELAFINLWDDTWQVIDGKQRLSTMIGFYENKFPLHIDGKEYYLKDLPKDYQYTINSFTFRYSVIHENKENDYDDDIKVNWFSFINFAGTPQDSEHLKSLNII